MSKQIIHELAMATQQGKMTFPQVVKGLLETGVESYLVDFAAKQKIHYLTDGTTHMVPMILEPGPIALEFKGAELVEAIRAAQADTVRYPEFVKRATAAGVIGYCVPGRQKGDLLWPQRRTAHRGVPKAAGISTTSSSIRRKDRRKSLPAASR
jgi:uncharacterized protein YbcV (DUF1398 family)